MEPDIFKAETICDLPTYLEFAKASRDASLPRTILGFFLSVLLIFFIFQLDTPLFLYFFLIFAAIAVLSAIYRTYAAKHGDLRYKRLLRANSGKEPHQILIFREDGILVQNRDTKNQLLYSYGQILTVTEAKHLLLLGMKGRQCLLVDKRWLKGGTRDELLTFLQSRCPNLKRKLRSGKPGRLVHAVTVLILCVGTVAALAHYPDLETTATGRLSNSMSYAEILAELEPLGITCADNSYLAQLDEADYDTDAMAYDKVLGLLCYLGFGEYDMETWEWTPSTNGVYWFDAEVMNVDTMYSDFLRGVSALGGGELDFTNIQEDYSAVNWERGTGTVSISFEWQSSTYGMNANMMNDWFDVSVMETVCDIIGRKSGKNLYYAYDGGQGYLLFYGDAQWAAEFTELTGITLSH